ncbi:unnamed protein product [Acanthoscelides obtectus]|uniref:Uncharacterized protein n=1 Tax=Acanthoscelides obtectus TaxID=200917 RepID=A0A9P0Q052_ACAOB|nr:unnamed protein product [Acanthoscelides obtectus]CAK1629272.1 hypothetical protein AOBTE_LOCUS5645 [Acanthoscelides obtectus]
MGPSFTGLTNPPIWNNVDGRTVGTAGKKKDRDNSQVLNCFTFKSKVSRVRVSLQRYCRYFFQYSCSTHTAPAVEISRRRNACPKFQGDAIWEKISGVKGKPATKETAVVCPLPPKKPETSRIPVPGVVRSPSPQLAPREPSSPKTPRSRSPFQPPVSSTPIPPDDMKINISKSIIRSPSPHPSQSESFEDIEYEDEEENDTSDVEEDDENSIIYSMPSVGSSSSSDFVRNEIVKNQNQTR